MALKVQTTSSPPPLHGGGAGRGDGEVALLGALGRLRLGFGLGLGDAAFDGDVEPGLAGGAHHQGRAGRHRHRAAGARLRLLAGTQARQDQRRPAGVGRRRDPGVDPEIGRRHHAVPVERRGDALGALAAGGKERRDHQDEHQPAQRVRIARGDLRHRRAGLQRVGRRAARAPDARARARPRTESPASGAMRSAIAVAGRCGSRLLRSSRRKPSIADGQRTRNSGTVAATARTKKTNSPMARPSGGSDTPEPEPGQREEQADRGRDRGQRRPQPLPEDRQPGAAAARAPAWLRRRGHGARSSAVIGRLRSKRLQSGESVQYQHLSTRRMVRQ